MLIMSQLLDLVQMMSDEPFVNTTDDESNRSNLGITGGVGTILECFKEAY